MDELVVLVSLENKYKSKDDIAYYAAKLYAAPKFDRFVALKTVDSLAAQGLLGTRVDRKYFLSPSGHAALLEAIPVLEVIRAHLAGAFWKTA